MRTSDATVQMAQPGDCPGRHHPYAHKDAHHRATRMFPAGHTLVFSTKTVKYMVELEFGVGFPTRLTLTKPND